MQPIALIFGSDPRIEAAEIAGLVSILVALINHFMQRRMLTVRLTAERQNLERQIESGVESHVAQQFEDRANLEQRIDTDIALQVHRLRAERDLERHKLELRHAFEERRKLLDLVARFRGRLVEASDLYNYRLLNLYANADKGWLDVRGDYSVLHYYFHSTVLRFLVLLSLATRFEREAFFIEEQAAEDPEEREPRADAVTFLWYCKGMRWTATDVSLFDGSPDYEVSRATDHFFTDQLRDICARVTNNDETELGLGEFVDLSTSAELRPAMRFFDGLSPNEDRLRWDRLAALHLIVMSFLNWYGYKRQQTDANRLRAVVDQLRRPYVAPNLRDWLPRLGLEAHARNVDEALARHAEPQASPSQPAT